MTTLDRKLKTYRESRARANKGRYYSSLDVIATQGGKGATIERVGWPAFTDHALFTSYINLPSESRPVINKDFKVYIRKEIRKYFM